MKQFSILVFTFLISLPIFGQLPTTGVSSSQDISGNKTEKKYHRARIYYNSPKGLVLLANQGLAVDHGKHKKGVYVESDFSENEIQKAKMLGMQVDILIDDVQQYYIDQNEGNGKSKLIEKNGSCNGSSAVNYPVPANFNHGTMGGFLTYSEMLAELDDMVALYPNLISAKSPISTFQTFEGRSIHWVRISDNPNIDEAEPEVLYDAIHHAREPASMQQLIYYMWYLLENYGTNPEVTSLVDNTEMYFIPIVNPDGYSQNEATNPNGGGMWRKNRFNTYGVDNNRNYDYIDGGGNSVWNTTGVSANVNNDTYPGTAPFSEIENQAMKWFVEQHNFKLALNNHTYSDLLLYPFGYATNQLTPDNSTYVTISGMMVAQNSMANIISAGLYPASGDSDDFMYGETSSHTKIFAFTPEIGTNAHGFWPAEVDIDALCESMVYLNLTTAHLATNYAKANDLMAPVISNINGYFIYDIQRLGLESPANFTVSIVPVTSNILTVGGVNSHLGMTLLQQDIDSISYTLDPSILPGDLITYEISVDNGQYISTQTITKTYGQVQIVFADAADNLNNWTASPTWATTSSTFYSSSTSITDSPGGNYTNNTNQTITLNNGANLNNAIAATLSFYGKWFLEDNYDYVQLEISTDGGANWIPQCGNYTNAGTVDQIPGEPLYDGSQATWVKEEISLSDYLGQSILVRFQIVSDGGVVDDGFYFDDFEINVVYASSGVAGDINGNGVIDAGEIAGDTNGNGTIDPGEIVGDTNGNGTIDTGEVAGDANGNGVIDAGEISGDTNGNGIIDSGEIAGDTNGNGVIDAGEVAGDTNGNGVIDGNEVGGDLNGDGQINNGEVGINENMQNGLFLGQNIPNPANETTIINYVLPQSVKTVNLFILNEMGQTIESIQLNSNSKNIQISTAHLAQGVYYYYIETAGEKSLTKKMAVVKQ